MSLYRYVASDPRKSRSHYFYAPFEGLDLFRYWSKSRADLLDEVDIGDASIPVSDFVPKIGSETINCEADLRSCAAVLAGNSISDDLQLLKAWATFVQRKIDITHRLRAQYDPKGKILSSEDAGPNAYAFAAYLLAWQMSFHGSNIERLKWLNALLKCNDILTVAVTAVSHLDSFAASCAKRALLIESKQVLHEAARLGILW